MELHNVDIGLITETNMNFRHPSNINFLFQMSKIIWNRNRIITACPPDKEHHSLSLPSPKKQQGGEMIILGPTIFHRAFSSGRYIYGRWTWTEIRGRKVQITTIISEYGICTFSSPGILTYESQLRRAQSTNNPTTSPTSLFWKNLTSFVCEILQNQHHIIIGFDAN